MCSMLGRLGVGVHLEGAEARACESDPAVRRDVA